MSQGIGQKTNLLDFILFLQHVVSRDRTQVIGLDSRHLQPGNHLTGLFGLFCSQSPGLLYNFQEALTCI